MKKILLLPGSIALAIGSPQPKLRFSVWGILPWVSGAVGAFAEKKYFKSLSYLILSYAFGFFLAWLNFIVIAQILAFLHISCAAISGSKQRKVSHASLATAMILGTHLFQSILFITDAASLGHLSLSFWGNYLHQFRSELNLSAFALLLIIAGWQIFSFKPSRAPQYEPSNGVLAYASFISLLGVFADQPFLILGLFVSCLIAEITSRELINII